MGKSNDERHCCREGSAKPGAQTADITLADVASLTLVGAIVYVLSKEPLLSRALKAAAYIGIFVLTIVLATAVSFWLHPGDFVAIVTAVKKGS